MRVIRFVGKCQQYGVVAIVFVDRVLAASSVSEKA